MQQGERPERRAQRQTGQPRDARRLDLVEEHAVLLLVDVGARDVADQLAEARQARERRAHVGCVLHGVADDAERLHGHRARLPDPELARLGPRVDRLPQRHPALGRHTAVRVAQIVGTQTASSRELIGR